MKIWAAFFVIVTMLLTYAGTFNPGDSEGTQGSGQMNTSANHCVDVSTLDKISLQFQHDGTDATDFALSLKASTKASAALAADYDAYPDSTQTITVSAAGSYWWSVNTISLGQICVVYTKGSASTGSYTVYFRKEVPTK